MRDLLLIHIDAATTRLTHDRSMTTVDVHEARKSIKRARAVLKLLRPSLAAPGFARSKVELRDAGRALSAVRDAQVVADRLEEMLQRAEIPRSSISAFADNLHADAALSDGSTTARPGNRTVALAGITAARRRLARASLPAKDWTPLGVGFRAIYRRGRQVMPGKVESGPAESMHEWRKLVKSYWHALEVFVPVRPTQIGRTIGSARRLADVLGEDHDLALLADKLQTMHENPKEPIRTLLAAIALRRRRLQRRALRIGAALYAEPPAVVERRLRRDWQQWRNGRARKA